MQRWRKRQQNMPWIHRCCSSEYRDFFWSFFPRLEKDHRGKIVRRRKEKCSVLKCATSSPTSEALIFISPAHCCTSHLITPSQVQSFEQLPGVRWVYRASRRHANKDGWSVLFAHSAQWEHVIMWKLRDSRSS